MRSAGNVRYLEMELCNEGHGNDTNIKRPTMLNLGEKMAKERLILVQSRELDLMIDQSGQQQQNRLLQISFARSEVPLKCSGDQGLQVLEKSLPARKTGHSVRQPQ